jgi:ribonuclease P protein component
MPGYFLELVVAPAIANIGRVGYVIGRKTMPLAVDRNRLRRGLREVLRRQRPGLARFDIIVRVKRTIVRTDIRAAVREGAALLAEVASGAFA